MPFITVTSGGSNIPDGVYPVTLVEIRGPKTVTAQRGPKAGQDIQLLDWQFAVDEGEFENEVVEASTSVASGPKSKMYGYLTALLGGKAPAEGTEFEATDLCGRRALATIRKDEGGWPRIENLGAMPASMMSAGFAKATGTPTQGTPVTRPVNGEPPAAPASPRDRLRMTPNEPVAAPTSTEPPADELPF